MLVTTVKASSSLFGTKAASQAADSTLTLFTQVWDKANKQQEFLD